MNDGCKMRISYPQEVHPHEKSKAKKHGKKPLFAPIKVKRRMSRERPVS